MFSAISLAFRQLPEREMRRPILLSLGWSVVALAFLSVGVGILIAHFIHGGGWLAWMAGFLGGATTAVVTWLLYPSMVLLVLGFYMEPVIRAVERRHYPDLPEPPAFPLGGLLWTGVKLAVSALFLNLLALPLYLLLPGANLPIYLFLNGYLIGRDYFYTVALRRVGSRGADDLWRDHRVSFLVNGMMIAGLFLLPVIDLIAPVVGIAACVHLVERLRQPFATPVAMGRT